MRYFLFLGGLLLSVRTLAQPPYSFVPNNPVTESWVITHLRPRHPRLLPPSAFATIRQQVDDTTSLVNLHYQRLVADADALLAEPTLERRPVGRRLLSVSREAIRRIGTLSLVYRVSQDERYRQRVEDELRAVCQFSDWNPSHFLDVAEMAYAVSLGLDRCYDALSDSTRTVAQEALIEKALCESLKEGGYRWIDAEHNWNQVCHGGLAVAAITVADQEPALAATIIGRALNKLPLALSAYYPDGAYPEGASYWFYATYYSAIAGSAFENAFGTDFSLSQSPGFQESALFSLLVAGPSGDYYNYFDAGAEGALSVRHYDLLTWFAARYPARRYVDAKGYRAALQSALAGDEPSHRFASDGLVWLSQHPPTLHLVPLPDAYVFRGKNPLAIIGNPLSQGRGFYLGAKGGRASLNHGNMDVGSFIFELDGVRWGVDPGNQNYNDLEQIMSGALWDSRQRGQRWSLLTKNNFGHSTLTVNDSLHRVGGAAPLTGHQLEDAYPWVQFDLSAAFGGDVGRAVRTFKRADHRTLLVTDSIVPNPATRSVTWALMTQAQVTVTDTGATLTQDERTLSLTVKQPHTFTVTVTSLSPPPLPYDKNITGLKRIEVKVSPSSLQHAPLTVQLQGN